MGLTPFRALFVGALIIVAIGSRRRLRRSGSLPEPPMYRGSEHPPPGYWWDAEAMQWRPPEKKDQ